MRGIDFDRCESTPYFAEQNKVECKPGQYCRIHAIKAALFGPSAAATAATSGDTGSHQ